MQNFEKKFSVALQIPSVGRSFMYRRSLGPRMEPFITEKRLDKARYPILNLIKLKFVNKTSISNPACQTSKMKSFATVVKGQKLLTIVAKLSILEVCGGPDNASGQIGTCNYLL